MPSGILSEEIAVNSLVQTLTANVPALRRLKILIHGQEVDTLAGHVTSTGFFDLIPAAHAVRAARRVGVQRAAAAAVLRSFISLIDTSCLLSEKLTSHEIHAR